MSKRWFNFYITNFFTLLRVIGIFALIPVYRFLGGYETFLLSAFCFFTDCIDGFLARRLESSTFFGSLFDALSDKVFLIINMLLLMSITNEAIIPIVLELSIALVQGYKYQKNMNIKANNVGKIKMWIAGISISLAYLLVDKVFLNNIGLSFINDISQNILFLILLLPLIISEILTLGSYIKEYIDEMKKNTVKELEKKENNDKKILEELKNVSFKDLLFNHKYYEKYKDYGNLKLVSTLTMKNRL